MSESEEEQIYSKPFSVCYFVTARCNETCKFCWGPKEYEDLDTNDSKRIIDKLTGKTKRVVFTGGEPLLRRDISELLNYAKIRGLEVALSTNSLELSEEFVKKNKDYIDWISIPLEGVSEGVNSIMRGPLHLSSAIRALELLGKYNIDTKVSTVATKKNLHELPDTGKMLEEYKKKTNAKLVWKIFQFSPRGVAKNYREQFVISTGEFAALENELQSRNHEIRIGFIKNTDVDSTYIMILPNGDVKIPVGEKDVDAGNILHLDLSEIVKDGLFDVKKQMKLKEMYLYDSEGTTI